MNGSMPLSNLEFSGFEATENLLRHLLRTDSAPLQSLKIRNAPLDTESDELHYSHCKHVSTLGSSQAFSSPVDRGLVQRAVLAARWRQPSSAVIRQLIDCHSQDGLVCLHLSNLPGVNDTVIRRLHSHALNLRHLELGGSCRITIQGIRDLAQIDLKTLCITDLDDHEIGSKALQELSCSEGKLATGLTHLAFEEFCLPDHQLDHVPKFSALRSLSLKKCKVEGADPNQVSRNEVKNVVEERLANQSDAQQRFGPEIDSVMEDANCRKCDACYSLVTDNRLMQRIENILGMPALFKFSILGSNIVEEASLAKQKGFACVVESVM